MCLVGGFPCRKQALLLLKFPTVKDWDLSNPNLWAEKFAVSFQHNTSCISFGQKYAFITKTGIF